MGNIQKVLVLYFFVFPPVLLSGCKGSVSHCVPTQTMQCENAKVYVLDSCGAPLDVIEICSCGCAPDGTTCEADCPEPCEGMTCDDPPVPSCLDETTRRTWTNPGTCSDGECSYEPSDEPCEHGCQDGVCLGDPCVGITCDQPPVPLCVDEGLIRNFEQEGQCRDGVCSYPYHDEGCSDCCYGAEINPTGNPIGGGPGYREILQSSDADWVVDDTSSLLAALDSASSGQVIYIEDDAIIDLTGYDNIPVAAGVTIASGRGLNDSLGGLIQTEQFDTFPLLIAGGENVRFSGLRIFGPDFSVGDHDYQNPVLSRGIQTGSQGFEVDNCEVAGFGHGAVVVYGENAEAYVHHNYIHNNARAGLGYGVVLDRSSCLIEANLFDSNRHSIAGTGRPGTSYEARYNIVQSHATGHYFDMHGAADFDKRISSAIWRFNEGAGEQARDTSVFHSNHCTLQSMDTATCWVEGKIETGILFDGIDDYLDCGNDQSLVSDTGSIEFWLRAERMDQEQQIMELFEDGQNFLSIYLDASNSIGILISEDGLQSLNVISDQSLSQAELLHIVITQDSTGVRMFINAQEFSTTGSNSGAWSGHLNLTEMLIGSGHQSSFRGMLDEVRMYSRALAPDEITRHFLGQADISGDSIFIHHNTFQDADMSSVVVRGVPAQPSRIHHNWFVDTNPDHAIRQTNAQGNLEIASNHFGPGVPVGTRLPVAIGRSLPDSGTAPLEVSFDASSSYVQPHGPSIVAWRWDFGDGQSAWGESVSHVFTQAGRYGVDLTVFDAKGCIAKAFVPVVVSPGPGYFLDFWVKDSYRGELSGYYVVQALVGGQVVWEDDVAGDKGWQHVSLDVNSLVSDRQSTEISLKVLNKTAILNTEFIELSVYLDDVFLFGGDQVGGDFEGASTWAYKESIPDWSGGVATEEARSGQRSYKIHFPYLHDCPQGANASITKSVRLLSQHMLAQWYLDDGHGSWAKDHSMFGHDGRLVNMDDTSWTTGAIGGALGFDGKDDRIEITSPQSIQSAQGTVDFWLRAQPGATGTILSLFNDADSQFSISLDQGGIVRLQRVESANTSLDLRSASPVDDGFFHHLAFVQDGSGVRIYTDGQEGTSGQNGPEWTHGPAFGKAQLGDGPRGLLSGQLDEVRIDDRPFGSAWIEQQAAKGHPLGIWHFDEGQGMSTYDVSGTHEGAMKNMEPSASWVAGKSGQGIWFDGQDDYLDFSTPGYFSSEQGSVEFWFRLDRLDENQDVLNLFEDGYENYLLIRINQNNQVYVRLEDDDTGLINLTTIESIDDNAFHHLVVTQDGFGARIFVDGTEARTWGDNGKAWTDHLVLTGFWMGRGHWSWFRGVVDELAVYPRALRAEEITRHASE